MPSLLIMVIGACTIELYLHDPDTLKDKRSVLKGLLARLRKEFTISAAEVGLHDAHHAATIGCAIVSTSAAHAQNLLDHVVAWIETNRPDLDVVDHHIEIIHFSSASGE
ncbi:MAG: DUF503 domain-containing protein [Anaerolinea sp.]|nr:DUF503 domain-containing protein [Anaerolinea sp.]MCC6976309.1 DUF503 domain-containing protein [Anaerolineae bacterium]